MTRDPAVLLRSDTASLPPPCCSPCNSLPCVRKPPGHRRRAFGSRRFQRCPRGNARSPRRLTRFRADRAGLSAASSVSAAVGCGSAWFASAIACVSSSSDGVPVATPAPLARSTSTAASGSFPARSEINSVAANVSSLRTERSISPQIDRCFAGPPRFFFTSTTKGRVGLFIDAFPGENRSHRRIQSSFSSATSSGPPIPLQPGPPAAG